MINIKKAAMKIVSKYLSAGDFDNMAWVDYVDGPPKGMKTQICESCRNGEHLSYGTLHLPTNFKNVIEKVKQEHTTDLEDYIDYELDNTLNMPLQHYTCKNVGMLDGKRVQCMCSATALAKGWLDLPY